MSNNDIDPSIAALLDDTEPYDFKKNSLDFEKNDSGKVRRK